MKYRAHVSLTAATKTPFGYKTVYSLTTDQPKSIVDFDNLEQLEAGVRAFVTPHGTGWIITVRLIPLEARKPRGFDALGERLQYITLAPSTATESVDPAVA